MKKIQKFIMVESTPEKIKAFTEYCKSKGMTKAGALRAAVKEKYGYDLNV
jgi:hypothetical protein